MNIYELAREAGVSIATVSRVVNGKAEVSPRTREKVELAMKKFDYIPSEIARGLVVNSMKTVGVMTVDIRDVYYANVAYTVEQELSKLGYTVILCNTGDDIKEKVKYLKILKQKKVDGIILVGSVFKDSNLDKTIAGVSEKIPIVIINGLVTAQNVYSLVCDDSAGIEEAVDYLYTQGRRSFLYLKDTDTFSARAKVDGFKKAMLSKNLKINERSVIGVDKGLNGAYSALKILLEEKYSFDAIICGDDLTAAGAIKCLWDFGIKVPQVVAVTGYNNSLISVCCTPEITSVDAMMVEMGRQAVEVFSKVMEKEIAEPVISIKPKLIVRGSTGEK